MDLLAYTQISDLEEIAKKNNIEVPRLRGYRLMKNESIISETDLEQYLILLPNNHTKTKNKLLDQFSVWNKYAGQEGILYIHARIGGNNWKAYGGPELAKQPWFLEKVDDTFDSTYCDIYAKIKD